MCNVEFTNLSKWSTNMTRHLGVLLVILLTAGICQAQTRYTVTDLGLPPTPNADVHGGINSAGAAAGSFTLATGDRHAFVVDPAHGGFTDLGTLGGPTSQATGINASGVVVGWSTTATGSTHAFRYSALAGIEDLHALVSLGGANSAALAIKDSGNFVGWSETASGERHAFFYDSESGRLIDLQEYGGWPATASAVYDVIESTARVVGVFENAAGESHGFYHSFQDSSFVDIGTLGGPSSAAFRIRKDVAIGTADLTATTRHAVRFLVGVGLQDLGAFGGSSTAFDVNAWGAIVGVAASATGDARAFVTHPATGVSDLNGLVDDPGWLLREAHGINNMGSIVGAGRLNGDFRLFLLTPETPSIDTTPPFLSLPSDITVDADGPAGSNVEFSVSADDDIDDEVRVTCAPGDGSFFPIGTTTVNCTATDSSNNTAHGSFTVTVRGFVAPPPGVIDLGTFSIGAVFAQLWGAFTFAVQPGSTLPPGLAVRTETPVWFPPDVHAGVIGVATEPGTYTFTLTRNGAPQDYRLTIAALAVKDYWQIPDAFVGAPYSYTLSALNAAGTVGWTRVNGQPPPGLRIDSNGLVSGIPEAPGFYTLSVTANDGTATVYRDFRIGIYKVSIVTPGLLPNATQGAAYAATLEATGGVAPYVFSAGFLPNGLTLDPSGVISGTPRTAPGPYSLNVMATDATGASYRKLMSLTVISVPPALPAISTNRRLDDCTFGTPCDLVLSVVSGGTAPFSWTIGGLPPGMDSRTGSGTTLSNVAPGDVEIWGTPTGTGVFTIQATVTGADGASATVTVPLRVSPLMLADHQQDGTLGAPYSQTLRVLGGSGPYSAVQTTGRLPLDVTFDPGTMLVSGTPGESGNFNVGLHVSDADGHSLDVTSYFFISGAINIFSNDDLGTVTLGSRYSQPLFGCCPSSLTWSPVDAAALPPGIKLSSSGLLSGTATAVGTYSFVVRATDGISTGLRRFTLAITPILITTGYSLPVGNVGSPYGGSPAGVRFHGVGGTPPYEWTLLPGSSLPGVSVVPSGALAGIPTAMGQYQFAVRVQDAAGFTAVGYFQVSFYPEGVTPPESVTTTYLGSFSIGDVWAQLNGPDLFSVPSGMELPAGFSLRTDTPFWFPPYAQAGVIGVATTPGTRRFTLLRDGVPQAYRFDVSPLAVKDLWVLPDAFVNSPYSYQLTALDNTGPVTWSADPSSLPPGMQVSESGLLWGTPTASGAFNIGLTAHDGTDMAFRGATVNVFDVQITTPGMLPDARQNVPYTTTIRAEGGAGGYTFTATRPPAGLVLHPDGTISGVPTFRSQWWFDVVATDVNGASVTRSMSIDSVGTPLMLPGIRVSNPLDAFDDCSIGSPCSQHAQVMDGGRSPFVWTATGLPPGMSFRIGRMTRSIGPGMVELWGVPTEMGTFQVELTVVDGNNQSATATFPLHVRPIHLSSSLQTGGIGVPYSERFTVVGGKPPYTAALVNGRLPAGLTFDPATLSVAGTPLEDGDFSPVFEFRDAEATPLRITAYFLITGGTSTLLITSGDDLGSIRPGIFYSNQLQACCAGVYEWSIAGGALPTGLTLSSNGLVSGTPSQDDSGTFTVLVRVEDIGNRENSAFRQFSVIVTPLTVSGVNLPVGTVGVPYSGSVTASGGTGLTWSVDPFQHLPTGLTVHDDGVIDGTPTTSGQYSFMLRATDSAGRSVSQWLTISIYPAGVTPPILTACIAPPAGLVSRWSAEGDASDRLGRNNGTLEPGTTFIDGRLGRGFGFNGTGGVVVPTTSNLNLSSVTVDAWIRLDQLPGLPFPIVLKGLSSSSNNYGLYAVRGDAATAELLFEWYNGGFHQPVSIGAGLTTSEFHHVAVTADGSVVRFYVDGRFVSEAIQDAPLVPNDLPLVIGSAEPYPNRFSGVIDEPGIHNRALSADGINAIYLSADAGECLRPSTLSVAPAQGPAGGTIEVSATLTSEGLPLSGRTIPFTLNGASIGSATTDPSGVARLSVSLVHVDAGTHALQATFNGDPVYFGATGSADLVVVPLTVDPPAIVIASPTELLYDLGSMVRAQYSCTNAVSCVGEIASGAPLDTATPGAKVFRITATDAYGNTTIQDVSYAVNLGVCVMPFSGMTAWLAGDDTPVESVSGNAASWTGTPAYAAGEVGHAFAVGNGNAVTLPFEQAGSFTLQAWVRTPDRLQPEFTGVLSTGLPGAHAASLQIELDGSGNYRLNAGDGEASWLVGPATDFFQHIAVTFDGATLALYLNGQLVQRDVWTGAPALGFQILKAGIDRDDAMPFAGTIDEVQVFNRALSDGDVHQTFLAGTHGICANHPPVAAPTASPNPAEATSAAGAMVLLDGTASTDPDQDPLTYTWREGTTTIDTTPTLSAPFSLGSHTVTLTVDDGRHRTASSDVTVDVVDRTPPVFAGIPTALTLEATGPSGATASWTPTAIDLVDGSVTAICTPEPGSVFALGTMSVTCGATDAHGNGAATGFPVTVVDTTGPVFVIAPAPVVAEATSPLGAIVFYTVSASDAVSGPAPVTCLPASGSLFPLGITPVACSATDARGNTTSSIFTVTVRDTTGPTAQITSPLRDAMPNAASVDVVVGTADFVGVTGVTVNGVPATRSAGTPQTGTWKANVPVALPVAPGGALRFDARAIDAAGNTGTATLFVDADGIPAAMDRSRAESADSSGSYSNDFNNGVTAGTVTRNGWTVKLSAAPAPDGVRATVSGTGSVARISACVGVAKEVRLDVVGETADIGCNPTTGTISVKAVSAVSQIELREQLTTGAWQQFNLRTGQSMSVGSPATASGTNTSPIAVQFVRVDATGRERVIGGYQLAAGASVDVSVTPDAPGRRAQFRFRVLRGRVPVTMDGVSRTLQTGEVASIVAPEVR